MPELPEDPIARVRQVFGDNVNAKPLRAPISEDSDADVVDLITRVCYYYPQYNLETAQMLTNDEVTALLVQAEKQRAIEYYNHALIAAAPHSKKGVMVTKLIKQ
jgi:hypothetical protein